jgi:hypothetical protein
MHNMCVLHINPENQGDIQKIYFWIHKGIATPTIVPLGSFIITGQVDTLNRCVRSEVNFINQLFVITA